MAKVFISVLGTGNYVPCTYSFKGEIGPQNTRFVQEATVHRFCRDWAEKDRVLIFTTEDAERKNWLNDGQTDKKTNQSIKQEGLQARLAALSLTVSPENVMIPEGRTEDEIWEIFQIIFKNLDYGDNVVFDITHSFRSIPMLVMVVLNYAKVVRSVSLKGIYYGAFEVLGTPDKVEKMPPAKRLAPIFDLTRFDYLLDWTVAIDRFLKAGDASLAAHLMASQQVKERYQEMGKITEKMLSFTRDLATCRGKDVSRDAKLLKQTIEQCKKTKSEPPFKHLMEHLEQGLASFTGDDVRDGLAAASWCLDHNLIQQGFTILQETLISHLVVKSGMDYNTSLFRQLATSAVYLVNKTEDDWKSPARDNKDLIYKFQDAFQEAPDFLKQFKKLYSKLSKFRNDIDHSGFVDKPLKSSEFEGYLKQMILEVRDFIESTR